MVVGGSTFALAFLAGGLSTLSPCVLPIVPIAMGSALSAHRFGPYALAVGLAVAYAVAGTALASFGHVGQLDGKVVRLIAAMSLTLVGSQLLFTSLQDRIGVRFGRIADFGRNLMDKVPADSLAGQFVLGALFGLVWSPCVGPTLGAAVSLAAQGQHIGVTILEMSAFGVGAAFPLLGIGLLSRKTFVRAQGRLLSAGTVGKKALGVVTLSIGGVILLGADKKLEAWALSFSPDWLVTLTTSI